MKILQNTLKIEETFSDVQLFLRVLRPQKVGPVGFPEMRHLYFLGPTYPHCSWASLLGS